MLPSWASARRVRLGNMSGGVLLGTTHWLVYLHARVSR
jgi:hypothetical protein